MSSKAHAHDHSAHVFPISMYVKTLLVLMFLMVATIAASFVHISDIHAGPITINGTLLSNLIAMFIAICKALLVISFFMHVKYGTTIIKLWCLIGFCWFPLMFFILMDYGTRKYEPAPAFEADRGGALMREVERKGEVPPPDKTPVVHAR